MNNSLPIGGLTHAFIAEGSTVVWTDVYRQLDAIGRYSVGMLALHDSIAIDSTVQAMTDNTSYQKLVDDGVPITGLQKHNNGLETPAYTEAELEQVEAYTRAQRVVATLEELPLVALRQLDQRTLPPVVVNLYRSAAHKPDSVVEQVVGGVENGSVALCTVDSDASRSSYIEQGLPEGAIHVIHNGISLEEFSPSATKRAQLRKELAIADNSPVILFVGRDSDEKDVPLFLRSAKLFLSANPDAHIIMSGTGLNAENPTYTDLFDALGDGKERIHALGRRNDQSSLYAASDVLALTSRTESRPLCILEAQAAGVGVVVATDVGDAADMIGGHGFITSRNPEEIATRWVEAYARKSELNFPLERRPELGKQRMVAAYDKTIASVVG